jgi:hypothetical protein
MKMFETLFDLATIPLDCVKDVVTLGGIITDEESALKQKAKKLDKNIND